MRIIKINASKNGGTAKNWYINLNFVEHAENVGGGDGKVTLVSGAEFEAPITEWQKYITFI